jgi:hypothetical protein
MRAVCEAWIIGRRDRHRCGAPSTHHIVASDGYAVSTWHACPDHVPAARLDMDITDVRAARGRAADVPSPDG